MAKEPCPPQNDKCLGCAKGNVSVVAYIDPCACPGELPADPVKGIELKTAGFNINPRVEEVQPDEQRGDGFAPDVSYDNDGFEGSFDGSLYLNNNGVILNAGMRNSSRAGPDTGANVDIEVDTVTGCYTRNDGGSFIDDGFWPGMVVDVTGFTAAENNACKMVCSVTDTELCVYQEQCKKTSPDSIQYFPQLLTEAPGAVVQILARVEIIPLGHVPKQITFERRFAGQEQYEIYPGGLVDTFGVDMAADDQNVSFNFDVTGSAKPLVDQETALGTVCPVENEDPQKFKNSWFFVDCKHHCGLTAFNFEIANNVETEDSLCADCTRLGVPTVTGEFSLFRTRDAAMRRAACEGDGLRLTVVTWSPDKQDFMLFSLNNVRVSYTSDPSNDSAVVDTFSFTANVDPQTGVPIFAQRSQEAKKIRRGRWTFCTGAAVFPWEITTTNDEGGATTPVVDYGDAVGSQTLPNGTTHTEAGYAYPAPYDTPGFYTSGSVWYPEDEGIVGLAAPNAGLIDTSLCGMDELETVDLSGNNLMSLNVVNHPDLTDLNLSGNPNLARVKLCDVSALTTVDISGTALSQGTVDGILCELANYGSTTPGTIDLSGGTSAAPSITDGVPCYDTLIAAGWTVTTN